MVHAYLSRRSSKDEMGGGHDNNWEVEPPNSPAIQHCAANMATVIQFNT